MRGGDEAPAFLASSQIEFAALSVLRPLIILLSKIEFFRSLFGIPKTRGCLGHSFHLSHSSFTINTA